MPRPNNGPRLKWLAKRGVFYIVWYEGGRERLRSTGETDGAAATAALETFLRERRIATGPSGPSDPSEFPCAEALDIYGRLHAPHTKDPARISYAIDALLPFWGEVPVGNITTETCRRYQRERGKMPATVRRELSTLQAAVNLSHKEGYLTRPVNVWLPEKPEGKTRWLTVNEAARLLNAARTARADVRLYLPLFIVLALYTGARKQAILTLRWPQIDLERGRINFAKPNEKRTNKRLAHIPITDRLMTFLRYAHDRRSGDLGFVIHDKGKRIQDIGDTSHGSLGKACQRAGLTDVSARTLRHTRGTWLAQAGVDMWKIAGWLGQTIATTTELYAHHHPDHMEDARRASDRRKA